MQITSNYPDHSDLLLTDRVEQYLLQEIEQMSHRGETLLPQQQDLARRCQVSLRTIRTVVDRLKERRVIRSIKGKGMFILPTLRETGNILVVTDSPEHPYTSMVIASISNVLIRQGLTPMLTSPGDLTRDFAGVLGVMLLTESRQVREFLARTALPYCAINDVFDMQLRQSVHHQTVRNNNYLMSFALTELLLLSGRERIFFFSSMNTHACGQEKIEGHCDAMRFYGREIDPRYVIQVPRDNDADVDGFCARTRQLLTGEFNRYRKKVALADISGTMTYPQSMFYHRIIEGVADASDIAVADYAETSKAYLTKMMVTTSLNQIINRALDLILRRAKPFSTCETVDEIKIRLNESGIWREYDYRSYLSTHQIK